MSRRTTKCNIKRIVAYDAVHVERNINAIFFNSIAARCSSKRSVRTCDIYRRRHQETFEACKVSGKLPGRVAREFKSDSHCDATELAVEPHVEITND